METNNKKPSGLLNVQTGKEHFSLDLYSPSQELNLFIEHYWIVNWDLRGQKPYLSENLPHPSVHLVFEKNQSSIYGVVMKKFSILLKEKGTVFGIKFRPGAFYPFVQQSMDHFTGQAIPSQNIFGEMMNEFESGIFSLTDQKEMIDLAESFLFSIIPNKDETLLHIHAIIEKMKSDPLINTVEDISEHFHLSVRTLQRLFKKYVGVNPKWVIRRYRLLEVADQLSNGHPQPWQQLVADLGYYDQSHFIRDFKSIVGRSPEEYIRKSI
ncbi:helix-turn-helix domain-containing protein [Heyndrickxia oleronia]|uniref:helix-turn-helix domain-containing protein n=1 Tax=Heyndrickxia oleronia TaxID=38875 RepID=UPI001C0E91CB|nr:AraC family transcriptional regulator [Heyndrickxia oleronia]MBU5211671.1 AraC family transcriptional regulator [Heyndrickxia oleronia]